MKLLVEAKVDTTSREEVPLESQKMLILEVELGPRTYKIKENKIKRLRARRGMI